MREIKFRDVVNDVIYYVMPSRLFKDLYHAIKSVYIEIKED